MFDFLTDELHYQFVMGQRDAPNPTNTQKSPVIWCSDFLHFQFISSSCWHLKGKYSKLYLTFINSKKQHIQNSNHLSSHGWFCEKSYSWHPLLLVFNVIIKHNLAFEQQVKHMNTVQVKHVNVIPLFHFFQHDVNTAHDWQPAESTKKWISCAKKNQMGLF